jgi:hypothetical protein
MKKSFVLGTVFAALVGGIAVAGDGIPSQAKLSKFGLGGMKVVNDDAGMEVRGKGFGVLSAFFGGVVAIPTGGFITIPDPDGEPGDTIDVATGGFFAIDPVGGSVTFGTEPTANPAPGTSTGFTSIFRHGSLGTVVFTDRNVDGTFNSTANVNTPWEVSATGATGAQIFTFKLSGGFHATGN